MIKVWTDAAKAGILERHGERGSMFAYLPGVPPTVGCDSLTSQASSWRLTASGSAFANQAKRLSSRLLMLLML
jgi:hypothetical protein